MFDRDFDTVALRLAAIVQSSDDAIVSKDLNGIIVTWNPAAERMFGYTAAEAVGQSIRLIIPADRQTEEDDVLARIRRGEDVSHFETIRQRKDGSLIPISLTISPVRDRTGTVIGASKIARDITERRLAEAALAAAEAARADLQRRLVALVAASRTLLVSPRVDHVLPGVLKLAAELIAADAYALWRADPRRGVWRVDRSQGLSDEFTRQEAGLTGATRGTRLTTPLVAEDVRAIPRIADRLIVYEREGIRSMLAMPLRVHGDASGTLVFYYRAPHRFDDVETETAAAIANLASAAITAAELYDAQRRSRAESDFLAEAGKAVSASLDYEDTLRTVARLAVPYFADWCAVDLADDSGAPRRLTIAHADPAREQLARRFLERYPQDPNAPYTAAHVIRTGESVRLEHISDDLIGARVADDEERRAIRELGVRSVMIVPLRARGQTLGALTFVAAESGRRYGVRDLAFAEEIANRAAMAVDNARAYEDARRADRVKDDFIAVLSHELRTPLNALLGYARMLKQGMLTADQHARAFDVIERNATSLVRIVNDVLDVSRIMSGKLRLNLEIVDLATLVAQSFDAVQAAADARNVRLEIGLPSAPLRVEVDADRLRQVIWNLLSNGVKFTPPGGRVRVDVRRLERERAVEIVVSDTGVGIAPEFLPHVFERFRQADSYLSREHGGLGLGLAIARNLLEMHGGTIAAASAGIGLGATFTVRLPQTIDPADARLDRVELPASGAVAAMTGVELDGIHVLAVDDDDDALLLTREILQAAGAHVTTAESGERALALLPESHPDVVLSDIGMPRMDGFEFIARVRGLDAPWHEVPAAALTAFTRPGDRERAIGAGFQMHLAKPIDPAELVAAVRTLARR